MASRGINVHSISLNSKIKTLDSVLGTQSHIIVIRFLYFWRDQILSSRIKFWYTLPDKLVLQCFIALRVLNMYTVKKGFEFKFIIFTTPFTHSVVNSLGAKYILERLFGCLIPIFCKYSPLDRSHILPLSDTSNIINQPQN